MDKRIKCTACKRVKFEEDFLKNQKILKTCLTCRNKTKKEIVPITVPNEVPVMVVTVPIPVVPVPVPVPIPVKHWIELSGYWIQPGDELKLHKKLLRKVNRHFQKQCAFPVHQYLSRWWMVDIRDHRMD